MFISGEGLDHIIFDHFLGCAIPSANRGLFLGLALNYTLPEYSAKLRQSARPRRGFEKYLDSAAAVRWYPFQCKITIFPGNLFKGLDITVRHLDIGNACALPDKVLYTLLSL